MIGLLPNERPLADLRLGLIQAISEDIFTRRTMVLTDKRLWLIERRLFSYSTSIVFLKDITAIEARRTLDLARCLVAAFLVVAGLLVMCVLPTLPDKQGGMVAGLVFGFICFVPALLFALFAITKSVFVYTAMKSIQFRLALTFSPNGLEAFVDGVQRAMSQYKE